MINKQRTIGWTWVLMLMSALPAAAQNVTIAAVVNEDIITSTALQARRDLTLTLNNIPLTAENQERATPRILQSLIDEALQLQEAKRLSLTVTDEEIDKAIAAMEESRGQPAGSMLRIIRDQGLSERALKDQFRAELAWSKVIQRKLRRNVIISEDEMGRAQQAEAADPGTPELRIAALSIPIRSAKAEAAAADLAKKIGESLRAGKSLSEVATEYAKQDIAITPPRWIEEAALQPNLQQALRTLNLGDVSPPLRSNNAYQLLQLVDRRTTKPLPDSTEVLLKQIVLSPPFNPDQKSLALLREQTETARANPGSCMDTNLGVTGTGADVSFVRTQLTGMASELRSVITNLAVGEVSEPMIAPKAITMVLLCERIEPSLAMQADTKKIRNKLFREKLELEAQKHLRDLRRDAFIDVKGS